MNLCSLLAHSLTLIRVDGKTQLVCNRCDDPWATTLLDYRNTSKRLQAMNAHLAESK